MTFPESDLLFSFPDDWVVRKFDETSAYQSLSGHGLKGVDFIALSPDGKLWLMEVKNYRPRFANEVEYRANRPDPEQLAKQVGTKFTDTLRLLRIVNRALTAKWWFRLWKRFRSVVPDRSSMYWFWTEAHQRITRERGIVYVFWLETPEQNVDYGHRVHGLLMQHLPVAGNLWVVEGEQPGEIPIRVTD